MAQTTSNFKLIFIGIFVAAGIFGVLVFSGIVKLGGGSTTTTAVTGTATIWGTFDSQAITPFISAYNLANPKVHIEYVEKDPSTFESDIVEAIADNTPPDLIIMPDDLAWSLSDKVTHIPFASLSAQTFTNTFTTAADVFSTTDGSLAIPWAADPLVMYYNRDLLQNAGIAQAPTTWKDFTASVPILAQKTSDLSLTQEAAALGTYGNIMHPKDILALLFMQGGSPFITASDGSLDVHFGTGALANESTAAVNAMNFYMGFSDPLGQAYTWNQGEPEDQSAFIQSNLAYYFGYGSEVPLIIAQNPNLNFGISIPPQASSGTSVTTGRVYGIAIPKNAPNQLLSFTAATLLASPASESALISSADTTLALMPVRRDVLAQKPTNDPYLGTLFDAALVQRSWVDPDPAGSDTVFSTLVSDISSSNLATDLALEKASQQISSLGATM